MRSSVSAMPRKYPENRDPLRRAYSRELQNLRRKGEREAKRLRELAKETTSSHARDSYRREAKNIMARVKRASSKGKTTEQVGKMLNRLSESLDPARARSRRNLQFKVELSQAQDGMGTSGALKGVTRNEVNAFFAVTSGFTTGRNGDKLELIRQGIKNKYGFEAKSYEELWDYVTSTEAYRKTIATTAMSTRGVDTESEAFQGVPHEGEPRYMVAYRL